MDPLLLGACVALITIMVLFSGVSVGLGLLIVSAGFLIVFDGVRSLELMPEILFGKLDNFALLSIPMFIIMGASIASTRAGADLYEALERWLTRVPGGLVISNLGACALFAAMSGSSPATCAAIGKMGIPEMRKRGYPDGVAAGSIAAGGTLGILIPPSVTMIVYGIATETSIGRLFLAGVIPGLMLVGLFMAWSLYSTWRSGNTVLLASASYSWKQRLEILPRVLPFLLIIVGVLYAMYGGIATPSETAAVGALLCLVIAVLIYRLWHPRDLWLVLRDSTKESVMILFIIAAAGVFSYMLSSLFITQSIAEWIGTLDVNRWVLMGTINVFLLIAGFFLPPVAVILMGMAGGGQATLLNACWAEFYGTRNLGAIKASVTALMVLGSAIGPGLSGWLIDIGVDYEQQMLGFAAAFGVAALMLLYPVAVVRRALAATP